MNVAPGAWRYALPLFAAALPALIISPGATALLAALGGAVLYFFRDPDRDVPFDGVVSPADGKVSVIREEGHRLRVGVFMNVWDVHVNRAPLGGTVESVEHTPGAHRPAFSKESDHNERVRVRFEDHEVTLIAGAFARRIHPYVEEGDAVDRGERIGHISFGSRADVLLPPEFDRDDLEVEAGESVTAGETVLARGSGIHSATGEGRSGLVDERSAVDGDSNPEAESEFEGESDGREDAAERPNGGESADRRPDEDGSSGGETAADSTDRKSDDGDGGIDGSDVLDDLDGIGMVDVRDRDGDRD